MKLKIKKVFVTTQEELDGFEIIKNILVKNNRDISEINYKDTTNYFSVYLKNITKWIIRFNFDASKKNIVTKISVETAKEYCPSYEIEQSPKGLGESRVFIKSIEELTNLEKLIIEAYNFVK